jgi:antitoxin CptB
MTDNIELARLQWACRRGMLELDLILEPYMQKRFRQADEAEQKAFIELLNCHDQELFDWLVKRQPASSPQLQAMVNILLADAKL